MNHVPTIEVDNPGYEPGHPGSIKRVIVERALRDDPLGQMHDRRQIEEYQYRAGREFQAAFEVISIGHLRSIDTTAEPVDGTPPARRIVTPRYLAAADLRCRWLKKLGEDDFRFVEAVLIHKMTLKEVAQRVYHSVDKAATTFVGHKFRECLDKIARVVGLMS